jgi:hypothetical protein
MADFACIYAGSYRHNSTEQLFCGCTKKQQGFQQSSVSSMVCSPPLLHTNVMRVLSWCWRSGMPHLPSLRKPWDGLRRQEPPRSQPHSIGEDHMAEPQETQQEKETRWAAQRAAHETQQRASRAARARRRGRNWLVGGAIVIIVAVMAMIMLL